MIVPSLLLWLSRTRAHGMEFAFRRLTQLSWTCRTIDLSYKQLTQYIPRSPGRKSRMEAFSFFICPYCKTCAAQSLVAPCDCGKHFESSGQVIDFQLRAISFPLLVLLAESHRQGWTMSLSSHSESQRLSRACLGSCPSTCCVFALCKQSPFPRHLCSKV